MIHLVLDTSIYRADPGRKSPAFKAIERLLKAKIVKLHVPYVVEREFQTQEREKHKEAMDKVLSGLSYLSGKGLSATTLKKIVTYQKEIQDLQQGILEDAEKEIIDWLENLDASRIPLCADQAEKAFEAYFHGNPPLKSLKSRKDIPDSFIARSVEKILSENGNLHFVVNDGNLKEAFDANPLVETYKNLADFVASDLIQDELLDLDLIESSEDILAAIKAFEEESNAIKAIIEKDVGEQLVWKTVSDAGVPDDNNEITINGYGEAENIELDFEEASYYGDGVCGVPFSLTIEVQAYYYIFKSDYYALDIDSKKYKPSISDHNDHYYEAEDTFEIFVKGVVTLSIDKNKLDSENPAECVDMDTIEISELTDIEVCE